MNIRFCPRCRRASPAEAAYCYYDGQDLRLVIPGLAEPWQLAKEFVFPSGKRCRTFDELVDACMQDRPVACALLRQGGFHRFFSSIGRTDIAQAVLLAVQNHPDSDEALEYFLSRLPTREPIRPKLDYLPRKLQFGRVLASGRRTLILRINNKGKGLLRGRVRLDGVSWLTVQGDPSRVHGSSGSPAASEQRNNAPDAVTWSPNFAQPASAEGSIPLVVAAEESVPVAYAEADPAPVVLPEDDVPVATLLPPGESTAQSYPISTWTSQEIQLTAVTEHLPAGQSYHASLVLETNGGTVEVPVEVEVSPVPFEKEPFKGITEPKYLAAQMRRHPKEAARLLQAGEVRSWFEMNNWVWPVVGDTAPGIAAVQQFYEALGVNKPPRLEIVPEQIDFTVQSEEPQSTSVVFRSPDPKWVYAWIRTSEPWLVAEPAMIYGPMKASFSITIQPNQLPGPGRHESAVQIQGNGGQRLQLLVRVHYPEIELPLLAWNLVGGLVGGISLAGLRLVVSLPDFLFRPRHWGALISHLPSRRLYGLCQMVAVALLSGTWLAWKLRQQNRGRDETFLGLVGGGWIGAIVGLVFASMLAQVEPKLLELLQYGHSSYLQGVPLMAVAVWYLIGTVLGTALAWLGRPGHTVIRWLARQFSELASVFGWKKVARFFAFRWS